MMVSDFRQECRLAWCWYAAGSVPEAGLSCRSDIADGRLSSLVGGNKMGKKEGVHTVHTLGFGSGRTGAGLARIPHISAGDQYLQGL